MSFTVHEALRTACTQTYKHTCYAGEKSLGTVQSHKIKQRDVGTQTHVHAAIHMMRTKIQMDIRWTVFEM